MCYNTYHLNSYSTFNLYDMKTTIKQIYDMKTTIKQIYARETTIKQMLAELILEAY